MQKLPCEIIVWDSLPAIRAAIAAEMVASGLSQKRVADILDMAPSAISQYISGREDTGLIFLMRSKTRSHLSPMTCAEEKWRTRAHGSVRSVLSSGEQSPVRSVRPVTKMRILLKVPARRGLPVILLRHDP